MKKQTADFLDGLLEIIFSFGRWLKYIVFNVGVKMIMFSFEIITILIFAFVLYFLFDSYVNHKVGLSLIQMSETEMQLQRAIQYNNEINTYTSTTGVFLGVITTLIGGISALFVNLISHILYKNKCNKEGKNE